MGQALEVVERWWKAVEAGDLDSTTNYTTPDCEITMPGVGRIDRDVMREQVLPMYLTGFPGFHHETLDAVEDGDRVAVRLRVILTHTGPFATPQGEVPPTGRTAVLDSADVVTVTNGRISSWHTYFDQASLLGQLGLLPTPAAPIDAAPPIETAVRGGNAVSGQELATRFAEAMESGDPAALVSLYAEDATMRHALFPAPLRGREAILAAETPLFAAFSDIAVRIVSVTESGAKVAFEWCVDATNTGDVPLPDGSTLPATGRRISLPGVEVVYLDDDGLIAEGHRYQDGMAFMGQLGLG